jgi:hypothetical protein
MHFMVGLYQIVGVIENVMIMNDKCAANLNTK